MNGTIVVKVFAPLSGGDTAVYTSSGLSYYRHSDWLGSSRLSSTTTRTVYYDAAYAPFGESYSETGTTDRNFTGQNQDMAADLYDFLFREYHPTEGRWISPDPAGIWAADSSAPQSWNRYGYVDNSPLGFIDLNGLCQTGYIYQSGNSTIANVFSTECYGGVWSLFGTILSDYFNPQFSSSQGGGTGGGGKASTDLTAKTTAPRSDATATSQMWSALAAWLTSGPKYIHYGSSDPYTKDFMNSNAMLYVNNQIQANCGSSSGGTAVGTVRAFLFTTLDALSGSPSVAEAQFGAFNASYNLNRNQAEITIRNPISNNSAFYHIPSGLSMSGSYADRFGRLQGNVPTGAVFQEMTITEPNPCF